MLLDKLGFSDFNKPFAPARTELDWLSRDPDEVDAYIADPLCGGPYTAGLWRDLTHGLFKIASEKEMSRVPSELPILIKETSAANADIAGYLQLWVKDDTPNILMVTDDAGTDFVVDVT